MRHTTDDCPGFTRKKRGNDFAYFDSSGRRIRDPAVLERIQSLAIPPAYEDVWICPDPRGHLQATGRDAKGRKQYRYHPQWRRLRDFGKFERMASFGFALPAMRRRVGHDLATSGLPRKKVLALIVRILDQTAIRIGNESYVTQNGHFGLTTLRERHVRIENGNLELHFRAKGGQRCKLQLKDRRVTNIIRRMHRLPGQRLFRYRDEHGRLRPVDSGAVNHYLQEHMGEAFTAKDFRTWTGTLEAAMRLAELPYDPHMSERKRRQLLNQVVQEVAEVLRNTPEVCRRAYIHPAIFEAWASGHLQQAMAGVSGSRTRHAEWVVAGLLDKLEGGSRR
ncbi:DNA topoisomerase IB [Dyella sp. KRB-257]